MALSSSGVASLTTSSLAVGTTQVSAAYQGAGGYAGSTSNQINQVVSQASTTTSVAVAPNPLVISQTVTFSATVAGVAPATGTPTGKVQFTLYGGDIGQPAQLDASGVATMSTPLSFVGHIPIGAVYLGDASYVGSTATPVFLDVEPPAPTGVVASAGVSSATVSWDAITVPRPDQSTLGSDTRGAQLYVPRYELTAHDKTTGVTSPAIDEGTSLAATVSGLTVGDAYYFTVVAVLTSSEAAPTRTVPMQTTSSAPSAPSNLVVPTSAAPQDTSKGATSAAVGTPGQAGSVQATASGGTGTITVARYGSDPTGGFKGSGAFFDVSISPGSTYTSLTITLCGIEPGGSIEWWNPITLGYEAVSNVAASSTAGCDDVTVTADTTPSISQMYGTVLAVVAAVPVAQLASTGSADLWLAPLGVLLLLAGVALLVASRRSEGLRRSIATLPLSEGDPAGRDRCAGPPLCNTDESSFESSLVTGGGHGADFRWSASGRRSGGRAGGIDWGDQLLERRLNELDDDPGEHGRDNLCLPLGCRRATAR